MKKIAVEVTRLFVLEVEDDVDTSDWLNVGLLISNQPNVAPEAVDLVAWDVPDGDVFSDASIAVEEAAREQRFEDALELFNLQMAKRSQFLL